MSIQKPFNLLKWIEDNKHLLKPPVANKNLYVDSGDYIVMIVAGPNARKDFHYNETEELFYQLEGEITVYVQDNGKKKAMKLSAGDMFLLPSKVPHSPSRTEGSIGLVIERKREGKDIPDGLLWFCDNCNHKLYEVYFELHNIETDFLTHFKHFYNSEHLRTCEKCGTIMESDPRFVVKD
ncbi:3-hydroxyanthranilate 3,4-dioxygenase [Flavobacterium sp.]|uniref:3-hydroxyanthranilate 3,4-dioxygenase n=1 Tax=Flavobacterium sp. TaxID=239 RepID=UPI002617D84F|nr:3-hydroxyanthranilate 3,4-dioxygenase [Flavobacterium sp.]